MAENKDQYGRPAPDDLIALEDNWLDEGILTEKQAKAIDHLDWYEYQWHNHSSPILVSRNAFDEATPELVVDVYTLADIGLYPPADAELMYIDSALHRYNDEDGWYHA